LSVGRDYTGQMFSKFFYWVNFEGKFFGHKFCVTWHHLGCQITHLRYVLNRTTYEDENTRFMVTFQQKNFCHKFYVTWHHFGCQITHFRYFFDETTYEDENTWTRVTFRRKKLGDVNFVIWHHLGVKLHILAIFRIERHVKMSTQDLG
jgi:hypothetical protein